MKIGPYGAEGAAGYYPGSFTLMTIYVAVTLRHKTQVNLTLKKNKHLVLEMHILNNTLQ